jgi:hypothetical protein
MINYIEDGFNESNIVAITAPVGKGKTTSSIEYCLDNNYKCIVVTAYTTTILDIIKRFPLFKPYYHNNKFDSDYIATTFESFQNMIDSKPELLNRFDVIIIDEYHLLWMERTFRNIYNKINEYLEQNTKPKILLSATPDIINKIDDNIWNSAAVRMCGLRSHIKVKSCDITYCNDLKTVFNYIKQNKYDVIYYNNNKKYFDYCMHDYELITSYTIKRKWDEIFDKDSNLIKPIFATKCVSTGLNIMNEGDMKVAIIGVNNTVTDLIQFIGRFRKANIYIDLYFPFKKDGFLGSETIHKIGNDSGKVAEYKLSTRVNSVNDMKEVLRHFQFDSEISVYESKQSYEPNIIPSKLFFRLYEVHPSIRDEFIKTKVNNVTYCTYIKDLHLLSDYIPLQDNLKPRTMSTLLKKLGLDIKPVKKNRRVVGYNIIK